jgi:hypothetical protein
MVRFRQNMSIGSRGRAFEWKYFLHWWSSLLRSNRLFANRSKMVRFSKTCQQITNRKSLSGFRMKIFSPLVGASVVAKSISRELGLLINGKIYAKHVSGFRTKIISPLGVASVTAESNLRESLESGKIYAKHDKPLIRSRGWALERIYGTTLFDSYSRKIIMHWLAKLTW